MRNMRASVLTLQWIVALSLRLLQKTYASKFAGVSTLFAYSLVRRVNLFNLPRSIERCLLFQFTYA